MQNDIRWKQRFYNYQKAISQLTKFIKKGELNELEEQGKSRQPRQTDRRNQNTEQSTANRHRLIQRQIPRNGEST